MKKLLSTLFAAVMAATLAVGLTACDNGDETQNETHTHSYATVWSNDETNHWYACTATAGTCDAPKKDEAAHTWNGGEVTTPATEDSDGVKTFTCTVCGKTRTESVQYEAPAAHTHSYATVWSNDETNHWYACTATAGTCDAPKKDEAAHTWNGGEVTTPATEDSDGVKTFTCTVCGKTRTESFQNTPEPTVTEEEWGAAFTLEALGDNFKLVLADDEDEEYTTTFVYVGDKLNVYTAKSNRIFVFDDSTFTRTHYGFGIVDELGNMVNDGTKWGRDTQTFTEDKWPSKRKASLDTPEEFLARYIDQYDDYEFDAANGVYNSKSEEGCYIKFQDKKLTEVVLNGGRVLITYGGQTVTLPAESDVVDLED